MYSVLRFLSKRSSRRVGLRFRKSSRFLWVLDGANNPPITREKTPNVMLVPKRILKIFFLEKI